MSRRSLHALLLLLFARIVTGAEQAPDDAIAVDPAVHKLDGAVSRMTAYLRAIPAFHVATATQWTLDGARQNAGSAHMGLRVRHPSAFRLEIAEKFEDKPVLVCASDGSMLTRFYRHGPVAIFSRGRGGIGQLLEDALTISNLKGTGLDVILRPDAHDYVMTSASDVKDCGEEDVQGERAQHFSVGWFGGSRVDLWVAADHEPVLLRWRRTLTLKIANEPHELRVESNLKWTLDATFAPDQAIIEMPAEAFEQRGVAFYAVAVGEDPDKVRAFVNAQRYTHAVVLDPDQQAAAAFRVTSLPVTVLIGKDGIMQAVHVGISRGRGQKLGTEIRRAKIICFLHDNVFANIKAVHGHGKGKAQQQREQAEQGALDRRHMGVDIGTALGRHPAAVAIPCFGAEIECRRCQDEQNPLVHAVEELTRHALDSLGVGML